MSSEQPFIQFAKDDYKKELESRLDKLKEDHELVLKKKSGGTKSKKLRHLNGEIDKISKELVSLEGFNSFIDKTDQGDDSMNSMDLHLGKFFK